MPCNLLRWHGDDIIASTRFVAGCRRHERDTYRNHEYSTTKGNHER